MVFGSTMHGNVKRWQVFLTGIRQIGCLLLFMYCESIHILYAY